MYALRKGFNYNITLNPNPHTSLQCATKCAHINYMFHSTHTHTHFNSQTNTKSHISTTTTSRNASHIHRGVAFFSSVSEPHALHWRIYYNSSYQVPSKYHWVYTQRSVSSRISLALDECVCGWQEHIRQVRSSLQSFVF